MTKPKVLFLVTSVIYFNNKGISYSKKRSIYSHVERELQTLDTIQSIRSHVPNAKIYLIEMGKKELINTELINSVDRFIYLGKNKLVRLVVDWKYKGLGEAVGLYTVRKLIDKNFDYYFKISGRYTLNQNFNINKFLESDKFTTKLYKSGISTRLYGFPKTLFNIWGNAIFRMIPNLLFGKSIEDSMLKFIKVVNINSIDPLGVEGFVAPDGNKVEE